MAKLIKDQIVEDKMQRTKWKRTKWHNSWFAHDLTRLHRYVVLLEVFYMYSCTNESPGTAHTAWHSFPSEWKVRMSNGIALWQRWGLNTQPRLVQCSKQQHHGNLTLLWMERYIASVKNFHLPFMVVDLSFYLRSLSIYIGKINCWN